MPSCHCLILGVVAVVCSSPISPCSSSRFQQRIYPWQKGPRVPGRELAANVCVVGAGSAGIGAASAARKGVKVILVEHKRNSAVLESMRWSVAGNPAPGVRSPARFLTE